mmetsp:Transcript_16705/g.39334  ORF Transcript_16705/g.39334 Transcript_16705/m.39334 type:complete len:247 (+) Transcript_16705:1-741(+)
MEERERLEAENAARLEKIQKIQMRVDGLTPLNEVGTVSNARHVWIDVNITPKTSAGAEDPPVTKGRIIIELFDDLLPEITRIFSQMVRSDNPPTYKGTSFFSIIPGENCEAGSGRDRPAFGRALDNERATLDAYHTTPGIVTLSDPSRDNIFSITFGECTKLDGRPPIGRVVYGVDVMHEIEQSGAANGKPTKSVVIQGGGDCDMSKGLSHYYKPMAVPVLRKADTGRMKIVGNRDVQASHWLRRG